MWMKRKKRKTGRDNKHVFTEQTPSQQRQFSPES